MRIGLNSGEVVVGKIGDDLRMDYTAQGHSVMLAQRAESLAEAGHVLLTAHTAALVEGYFQLRSLGETALRGVSEPLELFELEGVGGLRTRLDASRAAGFTQFVGRDAELAQIDAVFERALEGDGGVVGVVGEAGVGKSRLCDTFAERVRARGVPIYEARCPSHASTLSGIAARELVRSFCGVDESDTPDVARRKIAGTMVLIDEQFHEVLPLVFEFAGVAERDADPLPLDAGARRRRTVTLLRALTERRSDREAAVMLVDDLHWIDPDSDEFLADMITATRGTRTLVLVNFRPEYQAEWMTGARYQQIALRPLGRAESEALLDALLGRDASLAPVRDQLLERAGGNPFFAEELAKSLLESGVIEGERGACRLAAQAASIAIPETVHGVLSARIDRLPERGKRLLQTAAVVGRDFALTVLESVSDLAPNEVASVLDSLLQAEFVHEIQLYPQAEYRFKHALTQEVAYGSQLSDACKASHSRVAEALASQGEERADHCAGEIALHLEQAGDRPGAARWFARAAEAGSPRLSLAAGRYWQRVLDLSAGTDEADALALRLRAFGGALLGRWSEEETVFEDDERLYREARALAERLGDRNAQIFMESAFALLCLSGSTLESAQLEHLERALALIDETTPSALEISILQRLAWTHAWFGSAARSMEYAEQGLALGGHDPALDARMFGYNSIIALQSSLAHAQLSRGQLGEARATLDQALAMARSDGDPLSWFLCRYTRAVLCHVEGDRAGSLEQLESARRVVAALDSPTWLRPTWLRALAFCADDRDWEGALRTFEGERGLLSDEIPTVGPDLAAWQIGVTAALHVAPDEVVRGQARTLMDLESGSTEPFWLLSRARLVQALRGPEGDAEAAQYLDRAEEEIRDRDLQSLRPFLLFDRAEFAHLRGDGDARDRALTEAIELVKEMGAPLRAELYERRLAEWRAGE